MELIFSNSLKVIGIVIRKGVNGIDVIVWIEIVDIERKEKEKITTTTANWNRIWENKKNHRNSNNKNGSAGERERFWKEKGKTTHNRKDNTEKKMRLYYRWMDQKERKRYICWSHNNIHHWLRSRTISSLTSRFECCGD